MKYSYDFTVFIGRFQPFHLGHLYVIEEALNRAEHVIVLCGSAHLPRSLRNPWVFTEREEMIRNSFSNSENERLIIAPLMDMPYNDSQWVENVQAMVKGLVKAHYKAPHRSPSIALIGHQKDQSSYYLSLFPQWDSISVANKNNIDATTIRNEIFSNNDSPASTSSPLSESAKKLIPISTQVFLEKFCKSTAYKELYNEQKFIEKYKKGWESAPYPPVFVTVDAVVIQSGHVLVIERKASPGKGMLALPGGFVNQNERLVDACLRELREETKLKVPLPVLKGSIKAQKVFDDPNRSSRGRTITHAFYIELEPNTTLPKVKGSDDAKSAFWLPLAELEPGKMFEDHYFIIQNLLGGF